MPSQVLLTELKTIMLEEYGVELEPPAVFELGTSLTGFFESLIEINNYK